MQQRLFYRALTPLPRNGDARQTHAVAMPHPLAALPVLAQCPASWRSRRERGSTQLKESGPLPIRLQSRSGAVILPSSIMNAAVMPKTMCRSRVHLSPPMSDVDAVGSLATISSASDSPAKSSVGHADMAGVGNSDVDRCPTKSTPPCESAGVPHVVSQNAVLYQDVARAGRPSSSRAR